ncbi:hypothetical protein PPTS312_28710 [Pseudomonas putida]|uniref:Phage protein n=1 Tax=Pseudomonas putida TaxID=303 RepID=A0A7U6M2U3_PSEPU|nr:MULTISPECIES: hypothetical protein [Pseudomonas]MDD2124160.1 hypothetical protein [Pseudomonas monteilii]BBU44956.1 hypothetical protein PPTS312_28710 [Pseudomonas putida]
MSDIENENGFDLGAMVTEMTDSAGVADDVGPGDAVPSAIADDVEDYAEHDQRQHGHLAEQAEEDDSEQVDDQPQGKGQRHVPLGALQEERRARQAAQEQVRQMQAQMAAQQAQMQQFQQWQAQQQAAQQQAQIPTFEEDPQGHVEARLQQIEQAQQADVQRRQFEQASAHVDQQMRQAAPIVMQIEAEFTAQHPDYGQAYAHLDREVTALIQQQRPGATPEQHAFAKNIAMLGFIQHCADNNLNPAQLLYNKAQELGYQSAHRTPNGQIKQAPTSLSNLPAGGRAPDEQGAISASRIASMSNDEFDKMFEAMRRSSGEGQFGF